MFRLDVEKPIRLCSGITRRDFLHAGALPLAGLTLPAFLRMQAKAAENGAAGREDVNCILIFMVGGPSQLDTWDPKPDAPLEIRGPFRPIETNVSGIRISEIFPRMARHAEKYALVRSVHHTAPAVHDIGHQLMQTGRLFAEGVEHPHLGAVLSSVKGSRNGAPPNVVLPTPIGATGGNMPHGQGAGYLGKRHEPLLLAADPNRAEFQAEPALSASVASVRAGRRATLRASLEAEIDRFERSGGARLRDVAFHQAYAQVTANEARVAFNLAAEPEALRDRYGRNRFGQSCLLARRLVESGTRFVTINMFETVFNELSWDCHGSKPFTPLRAYGESVGPWFDHGFSTLLEDLSGRGMLESTLVVALGEFGRTPKLNPAGGRDHWPQCWSILFAGGGVKGGQVVGASDAIGGAPVERPVTPAEVAATIYQAVGVPLDHPLPGPDGKPVRVTDEGVQPVWELF